MAESRLSEALNLLREGHADEALERLRHLALDGRLLLAWREGLAAALAAAVGPAQRLALHPLAPELRELGSPAELPLAQQPPAFQRALLALVPPHLDPLVELQLDGLPETAELALWGREPEGVWQPLARLSRPQIAALLPLPVGAWRELLLVEQVPGSLQPERLHCFLHWRAALPPAAVAAGVAAIPRREPGLRACLLSLLPQVQELHVYLNDFDAVPDWLQALPRTQVYRSQDHGELGDAGKFFGHAHSRLPWYASCDDDLIYPPDYIARLLAAAQRWQAPVGVHASLLRYPVEQGYYAPQARQVLHYRIANAVDRRVHLLGTGTLLIAREQFPRLPRFAYRNMADLWFARHCAQQGLPLMAVARGDNWVHDSVALRDSIYLQNHEADSDQRLLVDAELQRLAPQLQGIKGQRPKLLVGIKTYNRLDYLRDCMDSLLATLDAERFEVVIAVADDGSDDGTLDYLAQLAMPHELHLLRHQRRYVAAQFNAIALLAQRVRADFVFVIDDDVHFKQPGWMGAYYDAALQSGFHHLCHYNLPHGAQLAQRRGDAFPPPRQQHREFPLEAHGGVEQAMGALFTLTPALIDAVGFADEVNFFVRGGWHADYSARCCRAGFNELQRFWDLVDANVYIGLQNTKVSDYRSAIAWGSPEFKRASTAPERERRAALRANGDRLHVDLNTARRGPLISLVEARTQRRLQLTDVFERIFVLNLDRRPDRLAALELRLRRLGIAWQRWPAVDGQSPEVRAAYEAYCRSRPAPDPARILKNGADFYRGLPDNARVAHLEARLQGPAIRSAGAWAYALGYQALLRHCVREGLDRVLVLDDDCLFHRDFERLFDACARELPRHWKLFQLGTMQYDWVLTRPYSKHLYLPEGVLVASHAVGLQRDAFPVLLDAIGRWSLPFDIGPLQDCSRLFGEASFVAQPNLIIQDQSESDINSSEVAAAEVRKKANVYRWQLDDYA